MSIAPDAAVALGMLRTFEPRLSGYGEANRCRSIEAGLRLLLAKPGSTQRSAELAKVSWKYRASSCATSVITTNMPRPSNGPTATSLTESSLLLIQLLQATSRSGSASSGSDHSANRQVADRGEDAAGDDIAFDAAEPEFDLIEPRGIGRSKMQVHLGMIGQELCDPLGLMGREVVGDDVDLASLGLQRSSWPKKATNSSAEIAGGGLTQDLAAFGVERSVERERAVPIVLEAVALGGPGLSGSTGSRRSSAWMAVFSSTQNTAACCGGLT